MEISTRRGEEKESQGVKSDLVLKLAAAFHESWRNSRRRDSIGEDGLLFELRIKKTKDKK